MPVVPASMVFELAMVGFCEVLQHTPLAEIVLPPSLVILPPLVAVVNEILDAAIVDAIVGVAKEAAVPAKFLHIPPENTCNSPPTLAEPQFVQNIIRPIAGLVIVAR